MHPIYSKAAWFFETLIYTQFEDNIGRYLCPKCKKHIYVTIKEGYGLIQAKGYSVTGNL